MGALLWLAFAAIAPVAAAVVEVTGEAAIVNDDVATARLEAISRARWAAVEQVAQVQVRSESFVNNFALLDESIIKRTSGVIEKSEIIAESRDGDIYLVRLQATVGVDSALAVIRQVARNRAVAVYIPAVLPDGVVWESHALSERLNGSFVAVGYEVVDVADSRLGIVLDDLHAAAAAGDSIALRSLLYRYLTNVVLLGDVSLVQSGRKGERDHTGILPFDVVTARLNYRLVGGDDSGLRTVLASGHLSAKGGGNGWRQASARAMVQLADDAAPEIVRMLQRSIVAKTPLVRIRVDGVSSLEADRAVREHLGRISWVARIESEGMGRYLVEYPEKTLYLAAALNKLEGVRVIDFGQNSVLARVEGYRGSVH